MKNNMENKKIALFTMCSDNLVEPCLTMLFSFLYNNEWFKQEGDIIILCDNNVCPLSDNNKQKFIDLYNDIKFINVDYEFYKPIIDYQENVIEAPWRFRPVSYKYEIFKDYGYDKHVFLDADIIIKDNIKELFYNSFNFGVCLDISYVMGLNRTNSVPNDNDMYFSSGVMVIGKSLMNDVIFNEIFNYIFKITSDYKFKKPSSARGKFVDQDILNEVMENCDIIPTEIYNCSPILLNKDNYMATKIIHYCGTYKPWETNFEEYDLANMFFYKYDFFRKNNIK